MNSVYEPSVSIIIPVYNGRDVIGDCLDSVFLVDYNNYEVIVVDDCSSDGSNSFVRDAYPAVRLLKTAANRGFAAAVNYGIREASFGIIVLLNMDAVVKKGWLKPLVQALCEDAGIGLVGSKMFSDDGKTLQHAGGIVFGNGLPAHRGNGELDTGQYDLPADVDYLCAASLGVRKSIFEKVGLFDEGFQPLYYEDTDFAHRVRKHGYRVVYIPESVLVHKGNVSTGGLTESFYYFFHKSRLRFIFKNYRWRELLSSFLPREMNWFTRELPAEMKGVLVKVYLVSLLSIIFLMAKRGLHRI